MSRRERHKSNDETKTELTESDWATRQERRRHDWTSAPAGGDSEFTVGQIIVYFWFLKHTLWSSKMFGSLKNNYFSFISRILRETYININDGVRKVTVRGFWSDVVWKQYVVVSDGGKKSSTDVIFNTYCPFPTFCLFLIHAFKSWLKLPSCLYTPSFFFSFFCPVFSFVLLKNVPLCLLLVQKSVL